MNAWTVQPLDSFRLGNYQLPLPCYICEENNLFDAATCRRCYAPLALTRAAMQRKGQKPNLVVTIGADDVGKSMYLGTLLDILSRERERSDVTSHGASSVSLQHSVMAALARGEFPSRTGRSAENWMWAQCRLQRRSRKEPLNVFFPDISGTSVFSEIDHPNTFRAISGAFGKATAVMLFVDSGRVQAGDKDEEFLALKILSYLGEMLEQEAEAAQAGQRRPKAMRIPPLAVVLAKADQCEACVDAPTEFVRNHMPGLWQHCVERYPQHEVFPVSIVGASTRRYLKGGGYEQIPLRVEPRGIMDPFRWTIRHILN
jgi:hypothetical protein